MTPTEYNVKAMAEVRRCVRLATPWLRCRALNREASRFERRDDWRGALYDHAATIALVLRELAAEQQGYPGSPQRRLNVTRFDERRYANSALEELTRRACIEEWPAGALIEQPPFGNRTSAARNRWAALAAALARDAGVSLDRKKLMAHIRERAKGGLPSINFLAPHKPPRRQKSPWKIRAVGT